MHLGMPPAGLGPPAPEVLKQKIRSPPAYVSPLCASDCVCLPRVPCLMMPFPRKFAGELAGLLLLLCVLETCLPTSQTPRPQNHDGHGGIFHPEGYFGQLIPLPPGVTRSDHT